MVLLGPRQIGKTTLAREIAAEIATKSDGEAVDDKAIVQIILAQLLIAGVLVAFLTLTA